MKVSIVIPTLGRDYVLLETINELFQLSAKADEIIIVDQSDFHNDETSSCLKDWDVKGEIKWIKLQYKSITNAMNTGLRKASSERVLFLDDDIIPDKDLVAAHLNCANINPTAIIAGRVLQPWHNGKEDSSEELFLFNSLKPRQINSFMGGNVLIPRKEAIRLGGFDTNFVKVAYHFEAEFAFRWINSGNQIFYEPKALIHHLKTQKGGTRSYGHHLTTIRPDHTVGRHYFYFCRYPGRIAVKKSIKDVVYSVLTKHHLKKPHWIPFTLISELAGFIWACLLFRSGRGIIKKDQINLLIISSHPIQYYSPIFCKLDQINDFKTTVLYLTLPDSKSQSLGFNHKFTWDIPLLNGYNYRVAHTFIGKGLFAGFMGVRLSRAWDEINHIKITDKPDAVLITGWHFWGMVQLFIALKMSNIPMILRMDSNSLRKRSFILDYIYSQFFSWVDICLSVGKQNQKFCIDCGMDKNHIIESPHAVNNDFFATIAKDEKVNDEAHKRQWNVPSNKFCFIYAGKLQEKKRPLDLLIAYQKAYSQINKDIHLLMVGTGPLLPECQKYVSDHNLPVSFTGFLNQTGMPKAYSISNCIVLPSDEGETWGLVINEAMACGLPAIVSDKVGCAPDLIIEGATGFSYKCGDTDQLAEKLVYMATHGELARQMGANAKQLVHTKYTLDGIVDSIQFALKRIVG